MNFSVTSVDLHKRLGKRHAFVVGVIEGLIASGRLVSKQDFDTMGALCEAGGVLCRIYRLTEPACQLISKVIQGKPAQAPSTKTDTQTKRRKAKANRRQAMNIIPMNYEGQEIRTIIDDLGEPWWVAKDVCEILEITTEQIRRLDDDEKGLRKVQTLGGIQELSAINESGLYTLILRSNKPQAKPFRKWVTSVVLPSIRKNGGYIGGQEQTDDPELIMARALQVAQSVIDQKAAQLTAATKQIEEQAPKVDFHDTVAASTNSVLLGDFCKLLPGAGIMIGRNNFFAWLRSEKILNHKNLPYQLYLDKGWFSVRECTYENENSNGPRTAFTTKVTGKGQTGLIRRLKETDSYERFMNKQAVSRAA